MGEYRFEETTPAGHLDITDAETAAHIILRGTAVGFTVVFDAADTFTTRRMYRLTNHTTQSVTVENYDGSITATLLPGNILQADVTDLSTEPGDWNFVQHLDRGDYTAAYSLLVTAATLGEPEILSMATDTVLSRAAGNIAATSIGEQTLLGRVTAGHVAALNAASIDGIIGSLYACLLGRTGGQTLYGGTAAGNNLILHTTSHGTKGNFGFGTSTFGTSAAGVLGIASGIAPTTSPADAIQMWAVDDADGASALNLRTEGGRLYQFGTKCGIGTETPSAPLDVEAVGASKTITDLLELTNRYNAADMDLTGTGILFRQWYYDVATPAVADCGKIAVVTDNDWTAAVGNSHMEFHTTGTRTMGEAARIDSHKNFLIGGTEQNANAYHALHMFNHGTVPIGATANSIIMFSVDSSDSTATLGMYLEQAVEAGAPTPDNKLKIKVDGTEYWIGLDAV